MRISEAAGSRETETCVGDHERSGVTGYWVGFDVGKRFHWLCVLDGEGAVLLSKRVEATEEQVEAVCSEIAALGDVEERVIGVDLLGGPATLLWRRSCWSAASGCATSPERP